MSVTRAIKDDSASVIAIGRQAVATQAEALWSFCDVDNPMDMASLRLEEIMTTRARTLVSGALARDAVVTMPQSRIALLSVRADVIGGQVAGLVHIHDVLRHGGA